jgi:cell division protein FtsX
MKYELPSWLSLAAPLAVAAVLLAALALAGKVPISYNLRNLRVRWKTTVLTALAFTVVVTLLIVMHAFATGVRRLSEESGYPANVICLSDGASDEMYSSLPTSATSDLARQEGVQSTADGRPLCSRELYVLVNQPVTDVEGERSKYHFVAIRGVEEPDLSALVHGLELTDGTWFSEAGVRDPSPSEGQGASAPGRTLVEAVVGDGLARELGKDLGKESLEIGDVLTLGPRQWVVTGILHGAQSTFGSEVWAKPQKVGEIFNKEGMYTSIVLRADSPARAKELAERLSRDFKKSAVTAMTEPDYFAKMAEVNQQLLGSIYLVATIMALGGVFGVMNTMFAAIRQRNTDIGVLRIVGFARWQVLASFLLEALLIAALGGLLGCALGYMVNGVNTNSMVGTGGGGVKRVSFPMIVDANVLAAGVLFTLVMGLLGGLLPAVSAMRLKPLESLR